MKIRLADGSGNLEFKYLVEDVDRHGNVRLYVKRRGHRKIRLRKSPGTQEFLDEYRDAMAGKSTAKSIGPAENTARSSLRWLVEQYYEGADFKVLDDRTRHVRRQILDAICLEPLSPQNAATIGSLPFANMPTSNIRTLRDRKASTPEAANARPKALRQVFVFAVNSDLVERNPARDVPYIRTGSQGFHTWTIEEVQVAIGGEGV